MSACKPLSLTTTTLIPYADMLCTAVKTCQDYRAGTPAWQGGQVPVVQQGQQYFVVRGLFWPSITEDTHVVAWMPNGGVFPGYAGGAFFDRACFG